MSGGKSKSKSQQVSEGSTFVDPTQVPFLSALRTAGTPPSSKPAPSAAVRFPPIRPALPAATTRTGRSSTSKPCKGLLAQHGGYRRGAKAPRTERWIFERQ